MSIIPSKAFARENQKTKRSTVTMKKTKIPSFMKTKKCSKQLKGERCFAANHTVIIGSELFYLCQKHFDHMMLKTNKFDRVEFLRASEL